MENTQNKQMGTEAAGHIAGVGIGATQSAMGGKPISSSILVVAAAILIVGGGHIQHFATQLFVMSVGCGVGLVGLVGWILSLREK